MKSHQDDLDIEDESVVCVTLSIFLSATVMPQRLRSLDPVPAPMLREGVGGCRPGLS